MTAQLETAILDTIGERSRARRLAASVDVRIALRRANGGVAYDRGAVDRALQRLRKAGRIAYDRKLGWQLVEQPTPTRPATLDQQLAALKAMPGYDAVVADLRYEHTEWATDEACSVGPGTERYLDKARECRAAFAAILALLGEVP